MSQQVLVDTGPIVALFSKRDEHHKACVEQLHDLSAPLITCLPIITESVWLLKENPIAVQKLLNGCNGALLQLHPINDSAFPRIAEIMQQYQSLQIQFADACLVYLAEELNINTIFTLDRRDFATIRTKDNLHFQLLPEPNLYP